MALPVLPEVVGDALQPGFHLHHGGPRLGLLLPTAGGQVDQLQSKGYRFRENGWHDVTMQAVLLFAIRDCHTNTAEFECLWFTAEGSMPEYRTRKIVNATLLVFL